MFRHFSSVIAIVVLTTMVANPSYSDDVTINLNQSTPSIDIPVTVVEPVDATISTTNGLSNSGTWVDSWIEVWQNTTRLAYNDDSFHSATNVLASIINIPLQAGEYFIRATSWNHVASNGTQFPIGSYLLSTNLVIPTPSPSITATPEPSPSITATPEPSPSITVTPEPSPSITVTPEPSPSITATPEPSPSITATPEPSPDQTQNLDPGPVFVPEIEQIQEPQLELVEEQVEEILVEPSIEPTPLIEIIPVEEEINNAIDELIVNEEQISDEQLQDITDLLLDNYEVDEVMPVAELLDELNDEQVLELLEQLNENQVIEYREGVELEAGVAVVFEQLSDPTALIEDLFSNPGQVAEALGQLGADMTEEEREDSQDVVVASIIATQAITAAMTAIPPTSSAPPSSSGPSGSGGGSGGEGGGGGGGSEGDKKSNRLKEKRKPKTMQKVRHHRNKRRMK